MSLKPLMKTTANRFTPFILLVIFIAFGIMSFLCHYALQHERFYRPVSSVIKTYQQATDENGNKNLWLESVPFTEITPEKNIVWDAAHYNRIREHLYMSDVDRWSNYAFFPLFPLIWRATGLNGFQICLFNWLVFCLGMLFIYFIFKDKVKIWQYLLVLCIPMSVVYMMPYTESLFFLFVAAGLYGIVKNNYPVYFIGFFLASMTRSSAALFITVFLCAEIINFFYARNIKSSAVNFAKRLLPIVAGVVAVMIIQKLNGSPRWFFFIEAQKFWGKYLSLPVLPFSDWSEEGQSITNPFLLMYFLPCVVIIIREFFKSLKQKDKTPLSVQEYVRLLSLLYLAGNVFIALLTQHGSLNSLARYMLCTPFFEFLLLDTYLRDRNKIWQLVYLLIGLAAMIICLRHFSHPNGMGIYLVMLVSLLVFFHRYIPEKLLYTLIILAVLFNTVWTSYLYNCFLLNAWIFT